MSDEAPRLSSFSGKRGKWLLGIGFAILVLVQGYAIYEQGNPFNDRPFDGETWRMFAGSEVPDNPRGKMATAVMHEVLRPGMSRAEIIEILGPPEVAAQAGGINSWPPIRYRLGMWSGERMHDDWLEIFFDAKGGFDHAVLIHPEQ